MDDRGEGKVSEKTEPPVSLEDVKDGGCTGDGLVEDKVQGNDGISTEYKETSESPDTTEVAEALKSQRKERKMKAGFQLYQVQKGKYSKSIANSDDAKNDGKRKESDRGDKNHEDKTFSKRSDQYQGRSRNIRPASNAKKPPADDIKGKVQKGKVKAQPARKSHANSKDDAFDVGSMENAVEEISQTTTKTQLHDHNKSRTRTEKSFHAEDEYPEPKNSGEFNKKPVTGKKFKSRNLDTDAFDVGDMENATEEISQTTTKKPPHGLNKSRARTEKTFHSENEYAEQKKSGEFNKKAVTGKKFKGRNLDSEPDSVENDEHPSKPEKTNMPSYSSDNKNGQYEDASRSRNRRSSRKASNRQRNRKKSFDKGGLSTDEKLSQKESHSESLTKEDWDTEAETETTTLPLNDNSTSTTSDSYDKVTKSEGQEEPHGHHKSVSFEPDGKEHKTAGLIRIPNLKLAEEMKESAKDHPVTFKESTHQQTSNEHKTIQHNTQIENPPYKETTVNPSVDSATILSIVEGKKDALESLLARGLQYDGVLEKALRLSFEIQSGYCQIILNDPAFAFKYDVENSLWKTAYYSLISSFRTCLERGDSSMDIMSSCFWSFLHNSDAAFHGLVTSLQQKNGFDLSYFVACPLQAPPANRQVKFALRSCHLILIFMGDLQRYIADLRRDQNYSQAHIRYQQALCLAPKNGKCYNQLGVIAVLCKHKLDAVYYYVRSLESSNPIQSARDRLTGIFQEICRKVDQLANPVTSGNVKEGQESSWADIAKLPKPKISCNDDVIDQSDHIRDEIWVFYKAGRPFKVMLSANGVIVDLTPCPVAQEEQPSANSKLQLKEVNKRFLLHFLFVHAKLYSRIGFETFTSVHQETITEFKTLLKFPRASSLKQPHLVKYMAINIFSIENLVSKQGDANDIPRGSPLDSGIIFALDFFAVLLEDCLALLMETVTPNGLMVLNQYLPAARIWLRWMALRGTIVGQSSVRTMTDIWDKIVAFANAVAMTLLQFKEFSRTDLLILYPEDVILAGFKPLLPNQKQEIQSVIHHESQILVLHVQRLESMVKLFNEIAATPTIPIQYNVEREMFSVDNKITFSPSPTKNSKILEIDEGSIHDEEIDRDVIIEEETEDTTWSSPQFEELKARKQALSDKLAEEEQKQQEREALLHVHSSKGRVVSENHPQYIVPDTNCFVEHLNEMKNIIDCNEFTVVVPIIVVSELDGLRNNSQIALVQTKARNAIEFLEDHFGQKNTCLRAITSKGSELDTIAFRNEDYSKDKGNNDDLILSCCLHYCDEALNKMGSAGEPLLIQRKVVLLTDDRNLRLKAHNRFVPTVTVPVFCRLARIS